MVKSNFHLLLSVIFFAGFFLVPLYFLPNALIAYEVPKVKLFLVWSGALFTFTYFFSLFFLKLKIEFPKRFLIAFIFLLVLFLISLFGTDFKRSLFGNFYRWDGLVTFLSLLAFGCSVYILKKVVDLEKLAFYSILLSFVCTFWWSLLQFFTNKLQVYAGFGQPVFLVGYLFVTSPIMFYGSEKYLKSRWTTYVLLLMMSLVGLMTKTIFGFLVIPFYILAVLYMGNKIRFWVLMVCIAFVSFVGTGIYVAEQVKIDGFVFESRERIFMKSLLAFKDRPLIGWGHANFDAAFVAVDWPIKINNDVYMDKAHSHLLEYLVTSGIVGLLLYLVVIFLLLSDLFKLKKNNKRYLLLVSIFYLIHSQSNIVGISEEILFWLVFGLVD